MKTFTAEQVFRMLSTQSFAEWYTSGDFEKFLTGADRNITKDQVIAFIENKLDRA